MKKIGLIALALVLSLGLMGAGLAFWEEDLTINGTVETGDIDPQFSCVANDPDDEDLNDPSEVGAWTACTASSDWGGSRYTKDVGSIDVELDDADTTNHTLLVTLKNGYPSYYGSVCYTITNHGTVPAKIKAILIGDVDVSTTSYCKEIDLNGTAATDIKVCVSSLEEGTELPCGTGVLGDLNIHVCEISDEGHDADESIVEGSFTVTIVVTQFNGTTGIA